VLILSLQAAVEDSSIHVDIGFLTWSLHACMTYSLTVHVEMSVYLFIYLVTYFTFFLAKSSKSTVTNLSVILQFCKIV